MSGASAESKTAGGDGGMGAEVRVKFQTKVAEIRVSETPFAVPTWFTRSKLSEAVNHLLGSEPHIPFDFLINGVFLRGSLRKFMRKNGLSSETVVELENVPAMSEPESKSELQHPDWIADIATFNG